MSRSYDNVKKVTRTVLTNGLIIAASVVVTLLLLEGAVRVIFPPNAEGEVQILGRSVPINVHQNRFNELHDFYVNRYLPQPFPRVIYDENVGWRNQPNYSWQSIYAYNGRGVRAGVEHSEKPIDGVLRIALFGDSVTEGFEVRLIDTWGYELERQLNEMGIAAEVINLGVGGFGIDQAYLQWQARAYEPDIVIFGLVPINMQRNFNIYRGTHGYRTRPFVYTKPSFRLRGADLELVNQPTLKPEDWLETQEQFSTTPYRHYDPYFPPLFRSRIAELLWMSTRQPVTTYQLTEDSQFVRLSEVIISNFAVEVEDSGAHFVLLHLPVLHEISIKRPPYQQMMARFAQNYGFVDPVPSFVEKNPDVQLQMPGGHYTPVVNRAVAQELAQYIVGCVDDLICERAAMRLGNHAAPSTFFASPQWQNTLLYYPTREATSSEMIAIELSGSMVPLSGDWDGDGIESIAIFDRERSQFRISDIGLVIDLPISGDDIVSLAGDWNGNGVDSVGAFQLSTQQFVLMDTNQRVQQFHFKPEDIGSDLYPISGDWNGDGTDSVGLRDLQSGQFVLQMNEISENRTVQFGPAGSAWLPLVGDWDGDGIDDLGVYNQDYGNVFFRTSSPINPIEPDFSFRESSRQVHIFSARLDDSASDGLAVLVK